MGSRVMNRGRITLDIVLVEKRQKKAVVIGVAIHGNELRQDKGMREA